tara:strand:- start:52880 stop:54133 length:1254 start_codon:yes stop_codon:yes gene_type:complete
MLPVWLDPGCVLMSDTQRYDVVVVGAGIAGSALATALSGRGLSIAVIEAREPGGAQLPQRLDVHSFDARVSALTPRSCALLERLGAWQEIERNRYCRYDHMTVWDAEGTGEIEFDARELNASILGTIVENRVITRALLGTMAVATDVTLLCPASLSSCVTQADGDMLVTLADGSALQSSLVVAADGALSAVRTMMGFRTREWDYGHQGIVATVQTEHAHQSTAWQRFIRTGPLALLPLPGDAEHHFCSIVWSAQDAAADDLMALDDSAFCAALERASEARLGAVVAASKRFAFPLRQRHAVDYVQPGVALVADAAHTIHPLAGQGINLGLQDIDVLAQEVASAAQRGLNIGDLATLHRYQRRRKGENLAMMAAMDGFKRLFEQQSLPLRWLRNAGMRGVGQIAPLKQRLMKHAMGLD